MLRTLITFLFALRNSMRLFRLNPPPPPILTQASVRKRGRNNKKLRTEERKKRERKKETKRKDKGKFIVKRMRENVSFAEGERERASGKSDRGKKT